MGGMDDIRRLCPRTVLILKGHKAYDGDTAALFAGADDSADIADTVEKIYGGEA